MNQNTKKKDLHFFNFAIIIVLMFGFGFLPPLSCITPLGMKVLGVFLGLLYGWFTEGFVWSSLLGMIAFCLTEYMTMTQILAAGIGSTTCVLLMFVFIFIAVVEDVGASRFIALWFITRKCFTGRPWLFSFSFLFATYILAATTTAVAIVILCWSILYTICDTVGYKKGDPYPTLMVIAIVFTCVLGSVALPFRVNPLLLVGAYEGLSGETVDYLKWIILSLPLSLISIAIFVIMGKFIFRINTSCLAKVDVTTFATKEELTLSAKQKTMLFSLLLMIIFMLLPSFVPNTIWISYVLNRIGAVGVVLGMVALICIIRIKSEPLFNFVETAAKSVQWPTIMLCATTLPITGALTDESTGIQEAINIILEPIFGNLPVGVFIAAVFIVAAILTNFANNVTVGIILISIFYSFAIDLGLNPAAMVVLISIAVHFAYLTPVAAPPAALLYSNTEWVNSKDILKYGLPVFVVCVVVVMLVGIPLSSIVF